MDQGNEELTQMINSKCCEVHPSLEDEVHESLSLRFTQICHNCQTKGFQSTQKLFMMIHDDNGWLYDVLITDDR